MLDQRIAWIANRLLLPLLIIGFVLLYYFEVRHLSEVNLVLIKPVVWIMIILFPIILFNEVKNWREKSFGEESEEEKEDNYEINAKLTPKLLIYIGSIGVYLLLLPQLGFIVVTLIFLPALMYFLGTKDIKLLILLSVFVTFGMYAMFDMWLGIPLPKGFLG